MNLQSIVEHWPYISASIVCILAFGLHVAGKRGESTDGSKFFQWLGHKENLKYLAYSLAFGLLGTVMKAELMELAGMTKDLTYLFFLWYGGAHSVSRWLGISAASKARKV